VIADILTTGWSLLSIDFLRAVILFNQRIDYEQEYAFLGWPVEPVEPVRIGKMSDFYYG
jgi:hypothetical protein